MNAIVETLPYKVGTIRPLKVTLSMLLAILEIALIGRFVWPSLFAITMLFVKPPFTFITSSIKVRIFT
jgi:hypothetical protein